MQEGEKIICKCPRGIINSLRMFEVPNYLIFKIEEYIYFVYREVTEEETMNRNNYELLYHQNKMFLLIGNAPSEEKAMLAIESYWDAILQLEQV